MALVAGALALGGCGDDSEGDSASTSTPGAVTTTSTAAKAGKPPSEAAYVRRADAVCEDYEDELISAIGVIGAAGEDFARYASALNAFIPVLEGLRADLGAIPPPRDDEFARRYLEVLDQLIATADRARAAAVAGDQSTLDQAVSDLTTTAPQARALAAEVGFKSCGKAGA